MYNDRILLLVNLPVYPRKGLHLATGSTEIISVVLRLPLKDLNSVTWLFKIFSLPPIPRTLGNILKWLGLVIFSQMFGCLVLFPCTLSVFCYSSVSIILSPSLLSSLKTLLCSSITSVVSTTNPVVQSSKFLHLFHIFELLS